MDRGLEKDFVSITKDLRCVVCQNQSLHESFAPISVDLKEQIHTMLERGEAKEEIIEYLTLRYGEFILYEPSFKPHTAALWLAPILLVFIGGAFLLNQLKPKLSRA